MNVSKECPTTTGPRQEFEICILAGGLSKRMGSDKSRLRLGTRSLAGHARGLARVVGISARVIRRDLVRRSGPLGGICTALLTSRADAVLFLSCDMPFVFPRTLRIVLRKSQRAKRAVFVRSNRAAGFPFLIRRLDLPTVLRHMAIRRLSLQELASALKPVFVNVPQRHVDSLININTQEELRAARRILRGS